MTRSEFLKKEILKQYKSVRQFAKDVDVPYTTLLSALDDKRDGVGRMAIETALKVCNSLGIDINVMSNIPEDNWIAVTTKEEKDLIRNYRKLDLYNRQTIEILLDRIAKGCQKETRKVPRPLYVLPASAGTGQFLDSDNYELTEFPEDVVPRDSTFAVRVSGDSMEPDYPDGSVVFVKQTKALEPGDVGIFILNDEGYLKILGDHGELVSINPKYEKITVSELDDCRIVGKVVGGYHE